MKTRNMKKRILIYAILVLGIILISPLSGGNYSFAEENAPDTDQIDSAEQSNPDGVMTLSASVPGQDALTTVAADEPNNEQNSKGDEGAELSDDASDDASDDTSDETDETQEIEIERIAGNDRYETAFAIAEELKTALEIEKFYTVVVASGEAYPDALSGAYLADQHDAPIILASKKNQGSIDSIVNYVKENLEEKGNIYILGGPAAVSEDLDKSLSENTNGIIKRVFGNDRFETNLAILKEANASANSDELLICSGLNYPDALSAASTGRPILLVGQALTDSQKNYLKADDSNYVIIGGPAAVSEDIEKEVKEYGTVERVYGNNRYSTSVAVAECYTYPRPIELDSDNNLSNSSNSEEETNETKDTKDTKDKNIALASGLNFPDGLAGGVLASKLGIPLILCDNTNPAIARNFAVGIGTKKLYIFGGKLLIDDNIGTGDKGFVRLGNEMCHIEDDGTISTMKWFDESEKKLYALASGIIARNTIFTVDGFKYGAGSDWTLQKGFVKIKGKEYYFLPTYRMPTKMETTYTKSYIQSPNYTKGRRGASVETIVIHYWGDDNSTFGGVVNWFLQRASRVSAHYVAMANRVTQMVSESDMAYHGGGPNINSRSIGIECRPAKTAGDQHTVAELVCDIWVRFGEIIPISEHRDHAATDCPGKWKASEVYQQAKALLVKKALI